MGKQRGNVSTANHFKGEQNDNCPYGFDSDHCNAHDGHGRQRPADNDLRPTRSVPKQRRVGQSSILDINDRGALPTRVSLRLFQLNWPTAYMRPR